MLGLFRTHVVALVAIVALTLLLESPWIVFPVYAGSAYQGINIMQFGNDEHHYLSRGKEVLEGHGVSQPYSTRR
jgi:hypothetical protein